ncbi:hypothetical protein ACW9HQ_43910, partial [Nocardia gipuzkoensis]
QPFTLPITAMLAPGQPLWEFARDTLSANRLRATDQLDAAAVDGLFTRQAGQPDDVASLTIWSLMVYEVWRELFRSPSRRVEPAVVPA